MTFKPHQYQTYCMQRMLTDSALGLFLGMGAGKTVITLTAVNELKYHQFKVNKVLVIAPKKVAEATWSNEAQKWDHLKLLRFVTVLGSLNKRISALCQKADIYVINRENVQWLVEYYKNDWPFDMVVIDESSSFKNHRAKRFKALTWVRKRISRIVELTGTPAPNGLIDLWAQVYLLDGGERLGKTITGYRERFFDPDQRSRQQIFSYKPKDGAGDSIQQKISDICIYINPDDYLKELPECNYIDVPVILDSKAERAYRKLEKDAILTIAETDITALTAASLGNKLLQLGNGAVYDENHNPIVIHDCKIEAFMEQVEALQGQSALVFYNFQHDRDRLLKALSKSGLRVRVYKDFHDEEDWNSHKIDLLLAHPASTAYGLNLQNGGNHIIWFGLNWSLELYQQANKRLHRQGQKQPVFIHNLVVKGSMDEDVLSALQGKSETQDSLLNALKARIERVKNE